MNVESLWKEVSPALEPFLRSGYRTETGQVQEGVFYATVYLRGKNWTVSFNVDFRDEVVDCDLLPTSGDGKEKSLIRYLVDHCGVRGWGHGASRAAFSPVDQIRQHIESLERHAPWVVFDREEGEAVTNRGAP